MCTTKLCKHYSTRSWGLCNTCRQRVWRENNQIRDIYNHLKSNAKRRGKEVEFSYLEFEEWLLTNHPEYVMLRGRGPDDLTLDRKKSNIGYRLSNMTVITNRENAKKGNQDIVLPPSGWKPVDIEAF